MDITSIVNSDMYLYLILPILIFLARIVDVSIGTLRIILMNRSYKLISGIIGFFEAIIWLLAITRIMNNLTNIYAYIGYALGFGVGTYIGVVLEEKISLGKVNLRIITHLDLKPLLDKLKRSENTYTSAGADGPDGKVNLIHTIIDRKALRAVLAEVMQYDPNAFYIVEDIRFVREFKINSIETQGNISKDMKKVK